MKCLRKKLQIMKENIVHALQVSLIRVLSPVTVKYKPKAKKKSKHQLIKKTKFVLLQGL